MPLLHPSPGECVDRQTILKLKIANAKAKEKESQHFQEEFESLVQFLEQHWFPKARGEWRQRFMQYTDELQTVNQTLWNLEDEIRELKAFPEEKRRLHRERIVAVAFAVPENNDVRARVVAKINALFGLSVPEKLYLDAAAGED